MMDLKKNTTQTLQTAIEPWLTVSNATAAVNFYTTAFNAIETYRMEDPGGGLVVKLSVAGACFWISGDTNDKESTPAVGTQSIKFVLTVADPDALFAQTIAAGAAEVFPVGEAYGWRLGRLTDPFGFDWEIGKPL